MKFDLAKLMKQALDDNKKELRKIAERPEESNVKQKIYQDKLFDQIVARYPEHNVTPEKMEMFIRIELGIVLSSDEEDALIKIKEGELDKAIKGMCDKYSYQILLNKKEDTDLLLNMLENIDKSKLKDRVKDHVSREFPYDRFYDIPIDKHLKKYIEDLENLSSLYLQCLGKLKSVNMSDLGE